MNSVFSVVTIVEEVTVFPEPVEENNIRRSRRIAEIKIKEQFTPTTQYDDIDEPIKVLKKNNKGGKKMITPTKKVHSHMIIEKKPYFILYFV